MTKSNKLRVRELNLIKYTETNLLMPSTELLITILRACREQCPLQLYKYSVHTKQIYFIKCLSYIRKEKRINDSPIGLKLPHSKFRTGGKSTPVNLMKPTLFSELLGHGKRKSSQVISPGINSLVSYHIFAKVDKNFALSYPTRDRHLDIQALICWPFGSHERVIHVWVAIRAFKKKYQEGCFAKFLL